MGASVNDDDEPATTMVGKEGTMRGIWSWGNVNHDGSVEWTQYENHDIISKLDQMYFKKVIINDDMIVDVASMTILNNNSYQVIRSSTPINGNEGDEGDEGGTIMNHDDDGGDIGTPNNGSIHWGYVNNMNNIFTEFHQSISDILEATFIQKIQISQEHYIDLKTMKQVRFDN
jgi:hypothetical protein